MKLRNVFLSGLFALAMPMVAVAETANLDQLLNLVKEGQARDNAAFEQRIAEFQGSKAKQEQLVRDAMAERDRLEALSADKEEQFRDNELIVAEKQAQLNDRLGSLKELFGVLQQVAGDTKSVFEGSVISSELPGREAFLTDLIRVAGATSELPSIEQLERLWFEMQREATYSGRIASYSADVVTPSGETTQQQVVRIGGFNAVSDGKYLNWDIESARLI